MMGKKQKVAHEDDKILNVDASMQGNLVFKDAVNLKINGKFEGNLNTRGTLTIGEHAEVRADIRGEKITVEGHVVGDILAEKELKIISPGCVVGNVIAPIFVVTEGAILQGNVQMLPKDGKPEWLMSGGILTAEELARYLEVDASVIFEWANTGKIPAIRDGNNWRFERTKIDEWLASEKAK